MIWRKWNNDMHLSRMRFVRNAVCIHNTCDTKLFFVLTQYEPILDFVGSDFLFEFD